jgi:serine protease AprX
MRHERPLSSGEVRSSALWGRGGRRARASALWGSTGRSVLAVLVLTASMILPGSGIATAFDGTAVVEASLMSEAKAKPKTLFNVIVQGNRGASASDVATETTNAGGKIKRKFTSTNGVSSTMPGSAIVGLANSRKILSITRDRKLKVTLYESAEMWRSSMGVAKLYNGPQAPAIAIVDSGVDATKAADFGTRVVTRVNFSSTTPRAVGDALGHGTMVAGLAAGAGGADALYRGAAPNAPIVDVAVTDSQGMAVTSDVIAAIDWIIANKGQYDIRVANFSLVGDVEASILYDPLNKAIERLWLSGVVVVAAAGNNGSPTGPVKIGAPANDPFIITVGAADIESSVAQTDDYRAEWSAFGYTADGFSKPDVAAPGRYMIGPVPATSVLATTKPDRMKAPGYMWMSGTSFAAPVVAGVAAQLLARNPGWSPDQVKGALMLTTVYNAAQGLAMGVGEINAGAAAAVTNPPNPNENLYQFVSGGSFDSSAWATHVSTSANWTSANWTSANWTSANWT